MSNNAYPEDITLLEYSRAIAREIRLIAAIVAIFAVLSVAVALVLPEIFRAETTVLEAGEQGGPTGSSAMLSQFGGLASLAGIDLSGLSGNQGNARAVLHSRTLLSEFIERNDLLPVLFADSWDAEAGRWTVDPEDAPTVWHGVKLLTEEIRSITEDVTLGVIRVTVDWHDPVIAAEWANGLVALANEMVQQQALQDAERNMEFLNRQIEETNVFELRQVLFGLVENEMKTIMLASVQSEYGFKIVDEAVPPEIRTFPHRALICVLGTVLGGFIALAVVLVRLVLRRQREAAGG